MAARIASPWGTSCSGRRSMALLIELPSRAAALPVGAASPIRRNCPCPASASHCSRASSRITVVVLPVPGPPVISPKRRRAASAQAIRCQSALRPGSAAASPTAPAACVPATCAELAAWAAFSAPALPGPPNSTISASCRRDSSSSDRPGSISRCRMPCCTSCSYCQKRRRYRRCCTSTSGVVRAPSADASSVDPVANGCATSDGHATQAACQSASVSVFSQGSTGIDSTCIGCSSTACRSRQTCPRPSCQLHSAAASSTGGNAGDGSAPSARKCASSRSMRRSQPSSCQRARSASMPGTSVGSATSGSPPVSGIAANRSPVSLS